MMRSSSLQHRCLNSLSVFTRAASLSTAPSSSTLKCATRTTLCASSSSSSPTCTPARFNSTWSAPPRPLIFTPNSTTSKSTAHASSFTYNDGSSSSLQPKSLLVYKTSQLHYMRGFGWILIALILPVTAYATWPLIYEDWTLSEEEKEAAKKRQKSSEMLPSDNIDDAIPAPPSHPISRISELPHFSSTPLIALNIALLSCVLMLTRFNRRLIHQIRLFPQQRLLVFDVVGTLSTGGSKKSLQRVVRLDAVLPPFGRNANPTALRNQFEVMEHPKASVPATPAAIISSSSTPPPPSSPSSSSSTLSLTPLSRYSLFPLPNIASRASDFSTQEKEILNEFFLRLLTTNVHTNEQISALEKVAKMHGKEQEVEWK